MKRSLFFGIMVAFCLQVRAEALFLILQDGAIGNIEIVKDLNRKMQKFVTALKAACNNYDKKLQTERDIIDKDPNAVDFKAKDVAWQNKVIAYKRRTAEFDKSLEALMEKKIMEIQAIVDKVLADISAKHGGKLIVKSNALAYVPTGYVDVSSEFIKDANTIEKKINLALPMINLEA